MLSGGKAGTIKGTLQLGQGIVLPANLSAALNFFLQALQENWTGMCNNPREST